MSKFKNFLYNKKPGSGLYILVWFIAIGSANIVTTLIDSYFAVTFVNSVSDITFQFLSIIITIETAIFIVVVIFIYKKFPNIKISKVAVWFYVLNFFATGRTFGQIKDDLSGLNTGIDLGNFAVLLLCMYIAICLIFRQYFRKTKQW